MCVLLVFESDDGCCPLLDDERRLLSSFLGFVDRHSGDQVDTIAIQYR